MHLTMITNPRTIHCVDIGAFPDLMQLLVRIDSIYQSLQFLILTQWYFKFHGCSLFYVGCRLVAGWAIRTG